MAWQTIFPCGEYFIQTLKSKMISTCTVGSKIDKNVANKKLN